MAFALQHLKQTTFLAQIPTHYLYTTVSQSYSHRIPWNEKDCLFCLRYHEATSSGDRPFLTRQSKDPLMDQREDAAHWTKECRIHQWELPLDCQRRTRARDLPCVSAPSWTTTSPLGWASIRSVRAGLGYLSYNLLSTWSIPSSCLAVLSSINLEQAVDHEQVM